MVEPGPQWDVAAQRRPVWHWTKEAEVVDVNLSDAQTTSRAAMACEHPEPEAL